MGRCGHYKCFNSYSAGIVFRRNLTSTDVKFWLLKTIPALWNVFEITSVQIIFTTFSTTLCPRHWSSLAYMLARNPIHFISFVTEIFQKMCTCRNHLPNLHDFQQSRHRDALLHQERYLPLILLMSGLQTTVTTAIFRDVTPGHWYQYRVAAVNLQGGRGVSAPSEPISLSGGKPYFIQFV